MSVIAKELTVAKREAAEQTSSASKGDKAAMKLISKIMGEAFRITQQRYDDACSLCSIFKSRGNSSGTVDAVESSLLHILEKEDLR